MDFASPETVSGALVGAALGYARKRGVDVADILARIGVTPEQLEFDVRIPASSLDQVWEDAAIAARDPCLGLRFAEEAKIGAFDALDYGFNLSRTLGGAVDRYARFYRVLGDHLALERSVRGSATVFRRVRQMAPQQAEAYFAVLVVRARALTGTRVAPLEVRFSHPGPRDAAPHEALFLAPVRFGCGASELILSNEDLALPGRAPNPGLSSVLDRYMRQIVGRLPKDESFRERARAAIAAQLQDNCGQRPSLETTARQLHMSPRSLQRRLREQGTSHSELMQSVRIDIAERLVFDRKLSITEIAFLLGFEDLSGFRRAYKRWTGRAPSQARCG
jgi:AraC-like DNA-binding protein